jgi:hypothetical protein
MEQDSAVQHSQAASEDVPSDALVGNFSVYPCSKCYRDLQQCDLTFPSCSRCARNKFDCVYTKTEPKANHVSTVLNAMNRAVDQWHDFFDGKSKWLAKKPQQRDLSTKTKPQPPFTWKVYSKQNQGLSMESNVTSFTDLHKLLAQFAVSFFSIPKSISDRASMIAEVDWQHMENNTESTSQQLVSAEARQDLFPFAIWNAWAVSMHSLPQGYPIDTSEQLTNQLIELFCSTPCCSSSRFPCLDTDDFLKRYYDPENQPSKLLTYAICAMSARNAFQVHCWSGDSGFSAVHYTMGKALSTAYCVQAREIFSDCFDSPTLENIQGTFLLSYAMHQNGFFNGIYLYEWISFALAQDLGLYDSNRTLTRSENLSLWTIYYYNAWYKVLQGGACDAVHLNQYYPTTQPVMPPPPLTNPSSSQDIIYNLWYHLIKLQVLRHDLMSRMVIAQEASRREAPFQLDLFNLQKQLFDSYATVPLEWQNPDPQTLLHTSERPTLGLHNAGGKLSVNIDDLTGFCIINLHVHYNINKILLYQSFLPASSAPTTPLSLQCLATCIQAANSITQCLDVMINKRKDCNLPILALVFANTIYLKLLTYNDARFQRFAKTSLQRSIKLAKSSSAYSYDFELCKRLVAIMETTVQEAIAQQQTRAPVKTQKSTGNKDSNSDPVTDMDVDDALACSYSTSSTAPELDIPVKQEQSLRDSNSIASSVTYQDDTPPSMEKNWSDREMSSGSHSNNPDTEVIIKLEERHDSFAIADSLLKDVWKAVDEVRCSI